MGSKRSNLIGVVAVGAALVVTDAAQAADGTDAASRIDQLLHDIDQQRQRLEDQAKQLEREREALRAQEAELIQLRTNLAEDTPVAPVIEQVAEGALPQPTRRPPAPATGDLPARAKVIADHVEPELARQAKSGEGRTAKNSFASIAAPKSDLFASAEPFKDDRPAPSSPGGRETLRDVVRRAIAPTLSAQTEVGARPEEDPDGIDIAVIADRGGVLTPRGTLVVDPSIDYSHSSVNRFFFDGVEIVDALLIGILEAQDIDRDAFTSSVGLRYGLTKRMEVSARTSWIYRDDRTDAQAVDATGSRNLTELDGKGFGDIDFGVNYQINRPKGNFPYFVANTRFKSNTGTGPFDVDRDLQTGLERELPSGSGFWTIEPSFTMIYPSDPAVLFMNIGYQYTVEDTVDKIILDRTVQTIRAGTGDVNQDGVVDTAGLYGVAETPAIFDSDRTIRRIGTVDPGDALSLSVGMGLGLNDSVSLSFGYEHSWVFGTETEQFVTVTTNGAIDPARTGRSISNSSDAQVGALLMGASVNVSENVGLNFNVAVGVTADSPDVRISVRAPFSWELFTR